VALGWGLWEGPARFYFWDPFLSSRTLRSAHYLIITQLLIDFQKKWLNIRLGLKPRYYFEEKSSGRARKRFATVGMFSTSHAVAFLASQNRGALFAEMTQWPL
jgi:hypothetical protein